MAVGSKYGPNDTSTHAGNGFTAFPGLFLIKMIYYLLHWLNIEAEIDEFCYSPKNYHCWQYPCQGSVVYYGDADEKNADVNIALVAGRTTKKAMCSIYY